MRTTCLEDLPHPLLLVSKQVHNEASTYAEAVLYTRNELCGRPNDFSERISSFLRQCVSKVVTDGLDGYQGQQVNRTIFPNLRTVVVTGLVGRSASDSALSTECLGLYDYMLINNPNEVWDGGHDSRIVATARKVTDDYAMHDVPHYEARGFEIICMAAVALICKTATNPVLYPNGMKVMVRIC